MRKEYCVPEFCFPVIVPFQDYLCTVHTYVFLCKSVTVSDALPILIPRNPGFLLSYILYLFKFAHIIILGHVQVSVHVYVRMCVCMFTRVCMHVCVCVCACGSA